MVSYSVFRNMAKPEQGARSHELLLDPGADVLVADEAHLMKNDDAQVMGIAWNRGYIEVTPHLRSIRVNVVSASLVERRFSGDLHSCASSQN